MKIYSFPTFNLTKVLLTAEETNTPYTLELLDLTKGEHKSPHHLERHPLGRVPAVEIDGQYYFESNNLCRLIAERAGNQLYGATPEAHAEVNQWVDLLAHHVGRWLANCTFERAIKPKLLGAATDEAAVAEAEGFLTQHLPALETRLTGREYIALEEISIADTIATGLFETTLYNGVDLAPYPNITRWLAAMRARPAYARAMSQLPGNETFAALAA